MLNTDNVLVEIKLRLGLADASQNILIDSYAGEIGYRILHYCNISDMPDDLLYTWAAMTIELLRMMEGSNAHLFGDNALTEEDAVNSIKLGDTTVSIGGKTATIASKTGGGTPKDILDSVVRQYRFDLIHYRRMRW